MSRRLRILSALALAVLGAAIAACGDEQEDTATVTTTVTQEAEEATTGATGGTGNQPDDADDADRNEGDEPDEVVALERFRSPTGNIACALSAANVRCDIQDKIWTAPRPEGCPSSSDFGQGLTLNAEGEAQVVCAGDTVLDPGAPVLEYGSVARVGSITCESEETGVECTNESGGEFSLSREEFELG